MKFHSHCGSNILLSDDDTVAEKRDKKDLHHDNTSLFSSQPLSDKTFTVSIKETKGDMVS